MASDTAQAAQDTASLPVIRIPTPVSKPDLITILGLVLSFGLISSAIALGQSNANFFNIPSVIIVICGTITATCISYSGVELKQSLPAIRGSFFKPVKNMSALAISMMELAAVSRKRGVLALSNYEAETRKEPFLYDSLRLVVDGYNPEDIKRILQQDIELAEERDKRAASILRRASEVAPAMGLIGTLVGLVQMLADLENPETIGPAMAVALLTTFYGAIMGTVVMAPLAAKLEKNAADEATVKTMAMKTAISMVNKENPRNLEMMINGLLPPSQRIRYFD